MFKSELEFQNFILGLNPKIIRNLQKISIKNIYKFAENYLKNLQNYRDIFTKKSPKQIELKVPNIKK